MGKLECEKIRKNEVTYKGGRGKEKNKKRNKRLTLGHICKHAAVGRGAAAAVTAPASTTLVVAMMMMVMVAFVALWGGAGRV